MVEEEWLAFLQGESAPVIVVAKPLKLMEIPACGELQISTNTKQVFLNLSELDINALFWALPIMEYWLPKEGIVKKQMKLVSNTVEEYETLMAKMNGLSYSTETIMKQINNPNARRIKFRDHRKLTVGISKKDIMNARGKVKKAFDNCFAMILRFLYHGSFREIHVKVFATGKMEIPGILNDEILHLAKRQVLLVLQPHIQEEIWFVENHMEENVLINSGFQCGFFINRIALFKILRGEKYNLETSYDSCIYPGIKCRFYYNNHLPRCKEYQRGVIDAADRTLKVIEFNGDKKYTEVSFMIFRTGKILIVGNCSESILTFIYSFIRDLLKEEFQSICAPNEVAVQKVKTVKKRKKRIFVTAAYFRKFICPRPVL